MESTFLSVNDYGDLLYMHAPTSLLRKLDSIYHAAICFVCAADSHIHHCVLYEALAWSFLYHRRKAHMY